MPDNDRLQRPCDRPIVGLEGGGGEISSCCRCAIQGFQEEGPSTSYVGKRPQRASASKAKSSVLFELSGLENVHFNDFIDNVFEPEDVSFQRASASLPDSVPIELEEERAAREAGEMAALDTVGDYETDPNVILEADVPQDIVIKTLKVS